ncbi:beta-lactamase hydrolase domain-containing protein [Planctomicrobium piriforme]|uniref:Putative phosphatase n=1 Tax=Planctomicrobium piriforme TaxID=1576369 RepID=A0A1I3DK01_9PLAN|nr:sulfur transferase domain-containing protein [Planctomicrobium piriforme]SFH87003.1 Putative phosphatase [Planctomicrobium piriforme]
MPRTASFAACTTALLLLWITVGPFALAQKTDVPQVAQPIPESTIHNLHRLGPNLYSGAGPETEVDFDALKKLGVVTIISVDGAVPNVEAARSRGMRYVHIPIQYRGVPIDAQRALVAAVRSSEGPVFVHCHHGLHRGPAAAAVCAISTNLLTNAQAVAFLKQAGTGSQYQGLYGDVAGFRMLTPDEEKSLPPVVLKESVEIGSLADAMVRIDALSDELQARLKAIDSKAVPTTPPAWQDEATQLHEELQEAARLLTGNADLKQKLQTSADVSLQLSKSAAPVTAAHLFATLKGQCKNCHAEYRDK